MQGKPQEALRIGGVYNYFEHDDPGDVQQFPIEGLTVSGAHGQINLVADQGPNNLL